MLTLFLSCLIREVITCRIGQGVRVLVVTLGCDRLVFRLNRLPRTIERWLVTLFVVRSCVSFRAVPSLLMALQVLISGLRP